ncbi:MAG: glucosamine-6-phosphate deaminase [Clostridia bacterium]|nr:glucosamine-6-phosphate deaminase [Clostridia bacterium]
MKIVIEQDYQKMSDRAAAIIARQVICKPDSVLGFATGSTPVGTYNKLAHMNKEGLVDFSKVTTFNLDEYAGLDENDQNSYRYFMNQNLFDHINIDKENTHVPKGNLDNLNEVCAQYEQAIANSGGIDLQLLGIGHNGHIGFNEPGASLDSLTHVVDLSSRTIEANARFFESAEKVPRQAISMGIKTIMKSKQIILLCSGKDKSDAIYEALFGDITQQVPASILQLHPNITFIIDKDAAEKICAKGLDK